MEAGKVDVFKPKAGNESVVKREATGDYDEENEYVEEGKKKIYVGGSKKKVSGGSSLECCQAERRTVDLSDANQYHRRHKVCEYHARLRECWWVACANGFVSNVAGLGRFQELAEFDDTKRSCRRRLAGHNERRRKNSESRAEGSTRKGTGSQLKDIACGQVGDRGRIKITIQENATFKHFHIR